MNAPVIKWERLPETSHEICKHADYHEELQKQGENPWIWCKNRAEWKYEGRCQCNGCIVLQLRCCEHSPLPDHVLVTHGNV